VTRLRLIGVPSSAGAHAPGLEQGPEKLRAAGLASALAAAGVMAQDWGDLPASSFATTAAESGARNLPAVMEVVSRVALDAESLVLFGFHPAQLSAGQWRRYASRNLYGVPVTDITAGTAGRRATTALARLRGKDALVCHLDVDVIDYARFPLADCPRYHGGLSLSDTFDALQAAAGHPGLACLTLTEVNPDHDPTGELTSQLVSRWSAAVAAGIQC